MGRPGTSRTGSASRTASSSEVTQVASASKEGPRGCPYFSDTGFKLSDCPRIMAERMVEGSIRRTRMGSSAVVSPLQIARRALVTASRVPSPSAAT